MKSKKILIKRKPLRRNRGVRMWIKRMGPVLTDEKNHPLVAADGDYFVEPMQRKLGLGPRTRKNLINRGTLNYRDGEHNGKGSFAHLEPRSIAQTLEEAFKLDRKDVYLEDPSWKISEKEGLTPEEHIVRNWNAYKGTSWLTNFQKAMRKIRQLNPLHEWRVISPREVIQVIGIGDHLTSLLKNHDLIIPKEGTEFAGPGSNNLVHIGALAQLLALATGKEQSDLFVPLNKDEQFRQFVRAYFEKRVLPSLLNHNLGPAVYYILTDAARRIGKEYGTLRHQADRDVIKTEQSHLLEKRVVRGIDVVQYELKNPCKHLMERSDMASLFGITDKEVSSFHLPISPEGGYDWQQAVLPFYQLVHRLIRAEFLRAETQKPIGIDAQKTYNHEAKRFYKCESTGEVYFHTRPNNKRIDHTSAEVRIALYGPEKKTKKVKN